MSKDTSLNLPQEFQKQKSTLELFLTYLKQQSTQDALGAQATKKGKLKEVVNYLHTLTFIVGSIKDEKGLRRLAEQAPALCEITNLARHLKTTTIPSSAIPSEACINALLKWYHKWVRHQALNEGK